MIKAIKAIWNMNGVAYIYKFNQELSLNSAAPLSFTERFSIFQPYVLLLQQFTVSVQSHSHKRLLLSVKKLPAQHQTSDKVSVWLVNMCVCVCVEHLAAVGIT